MPGSGVIFTAAAPTRGGAPDVEAGRAKARIPIIHLCGDADEVVPYPENTVILKERYEKLGGAITVMVKPGFKHHPHGLDDPTPLVEFILAHSAKP